MNDAEFWQILEPISKLDSTRRATALQQSLGAYPIEGLEQFEAAYRRQMKAAYTWDLWGAAYLINGGAADDGFEYFRSWLISMGHDVFSNAVAEPDSLADVISGQGEEIELEEFAYVASAVYAKKKGDPKARIPISKDLVSLGEPAGSEFQDDAEYFARRYPKLFEKFGS